MLDILIFFGRKSGVFFPGFTFNVGEIIGKEYSITEKNLQVDAATGALILHKYSMQKVLKLQK